MRNTFPTDRGQSPSRKRGAKRQNHDQEKKQGLGSIFITVGAPALLVIESRLLGQRLEKLVNKYTQGRHRMGTPYCWIIDMDLGTGYECHLGLLEAKAVSVLTAGVAISLAVDHVFAEFRADD